MPANPRRARRPVFTSDGYTIASCPGCDAGPVRDDLSETIHEYNWLRTCADCRLRLCRVCLEDGAALCVGCQHARDSLQRSEAPTTTHEVI